MASNIDNPHNSIFKQLIKTKPIAKELLREYLPDDLLAKTNLDDIQYSDKNFLDEKLQATHADMLLTVASNEEPLLIYVLAEHQSKPEQNMPWRMMNYMLRILDDYKQSYPTSKTLPLIYPILIYAGNRKYPYSTDFFDAFGAQKEKAKKYMTDAIQLVDLTKIKEDKQLSNTAWLALLQMTLIYGRKKTLREHIPTLKRCIHQICVDDGILDLNKISRIIGAVVTYLIETVDDPEPDTLIKNIAQGLPQPVEDDVMTIAQRLEERGMNKGILLGKEQGMTLGEQIAMRRVISKMLNCGLKSKQIAQFTGLSEKQVENLGTEKTEA